MPSSKLQSLPHAESARTWPRSQPLTCGPHLSSFGSSPNLTESTRSRDASLNPVHRKPGGTTTANPTRPSCQTQFTAETAETSERARDTQRLSLVAAHRRRALSAANSKRGRAPPRVHRCTGLHAGRVSSLAVTDARLR